MSEAWERFYEAIRSLSSWGTIQQRLANTYLFYLVDVKRQELPEEIRKNFDDLCKALTGGGSFDDETAVRNTASKLTNEEAFEYAERIIDMFDFIARRQGPM